MIPRHYQAAAVAAARASMAEHGAALLVLATGGGKTAIAGFTIAEEAAADPRSRFMVVQHRDELLTQNCAAISSITGLPTSIVKAEQNDWSGRIVFSSAPTLSRANRRESMVPFSHIIVDEAHHIEAAGYQNILAHARALSPDLRLLGMTATPERGDGKGLKRTFSSVAFSVSIGQLIEEGVLVSPRALTIDLANAELLDIDVEGGDYDMAQADDILNHAVHNDAVVEHWLTHAAGRRSIFFCTTIDHAHAVSGAFRSAGIDAETISAETPPKKRVELLRAFDAGQITVLTNCMLLTEGYDSQPVSCVGILRPMLHRSTFIQAVGRGLRRVDPERYPGVIKTDCVVLDFAGAAARHGSLDSMLGLQDSPDRKAADTDPTTPDQEDDDEGANIVEVRNISMAAIELIGRSPFAWESIQGDHSRRIATGFDAWAGVLGTPDDVWVAVGKTRGGYVRTLCVGGETQALCAADDFLRLNETSDAAKKSRRWLRERATDKQISLLNAQGIPAGYVTKYEANCLLSWCWNKNAIQQAIAKACR